MCNCPNIPSGNNKDIIIEPHDPFSKEGLIKSMNESDDFFNSREYIHVKNKFEKDGFTEYIHSGYHLFLRVRSSIESWMDQGPYVLVERQYGFYEDLNVIVSYCTSNYAKIGDKYQEYVVDDNGKKITLIINFENNSIELADDIIMKIYE